MQQSLSYKMTSNHTYSTGGNVSDAGLKGHAASPTGLVSTPASFHNLAISAKIDPHMMVVMGKMFSVTSDSSCARLTAGSAVMLFGNPLTSLSCFSMICWV